MATYVYEADINWVEDERIVTSQAFPGCFGGEDTARALPMPVPTTSPAIATAN